jgi:hypothetical protein
MVPSYTAKEIRGIGARNNTPATNEERDEERKPPK